MVSETFEIRLGELSTLAASRRTFRTRLESWGCANVDDVVLVFSELITNATVHAADASKAVISYEPPGLRIEVHDSSLAGPLMRRGDQRGGFGLRIVDQLSVSWGWEQTPTGKVVWSNVDCVTRC